MIMLASIIKTYFNKMCFPEHKIKNVSLLLPLKRYIHRRTHLSSHLFKTSVINQIFDNVLFTFTFESFAPLLLTRNTVIKTSLGNSLSKINTKTTKILKLLSKSQIGNPWVNWGLWKARKIIWIWKRYVRGRIGLFCFKNSQILALHHLKSSKW